MSLTERASDVLQRVFGHDAFRDGQESVILRLLDGKSVLAVFPTGAGKSLCYQLPALLLDGLTLVISPLIALMKDQIDALTERGVAAARFDSSLDRGQATEVMRSVRQRQLRILYISPERLANERFLHTIKSIRVDLLAVDEAHCISQWGHNFRPDYLRIANVAEQLGVGRVLALTATATPDVARDIGRAFHIADNNIVNTGFYRANLHLYATPCEPHERDELLLSRLRERPPGPSIVYVTLQRTAKEVADFLAHNGFDARPYHAGMDADDRNETQEAFMASDKMIVVATIAFGMGVDKSDIRSVYHYNLPKGLEHYMQEIGRAGRDGLVSTCEMFACPDDVVTLENFVFGDTPDDESVASLIDMVLRQEESFDVAMYNLSAEYDIRPLVVRTLFAYLEWDGVVEPTGQIYTTFKFQAVRPSREILASYDDKRAAFLRRLFAQAKKGRTWLTIDTDDASRQINEPRDRIVAAIGYLELQGDLIVQASGTRHSFRRLKKDVDPVDLRSRIVHRFHERERLDVQRIHDVLSLAAEPDCLTARVLSYFGEQRPPCGHCGRCDGLRAKPFAVRQRNSLGAIEEQTIKDLVDEGIAALSTPRRLTRFLCGLTSPATSRARLMGHPAFGALAHVLFRDVLTFVKDTTATARPARPVTR